MTGDEIQAGYLTVQPPPPPGHHRHARAFRSLRGLAERTPLRTKLITAVLALVIMALAAIGAASTYMLRSYVVSQHDTELKAIISGFNQNNQLPGWTPPPGSAETTRSDIVLALQVPGSQLKWTSRSPSGMGKSDPLPMLPSRANWAGPTGQPRLLTMRAASGPETWRVMAETVTAVYTNTGQSSPATLILAVDVGNLDLMTQRLIMFDLIVGGAIVVVLAIVAVGVIRANLRPLDDIELTAGQIAAGHLDHRVPELDPRTEVGSLGRSLNTMLSQIESAFHAREESELAAHRSEERMRRFIADASHELRTPLTTIRGFAEYYRQRGGVRKDQELFSGAYPGPAGTANGRYSALAGLTPAELDRIMQRLESEASRMGLLVEDLLQLARLDQQRPLDTSPVDLLTLAADAVQDARIVAPDRSIELTVAPGSAFLVNGDEARLRQVIGNLVSNALTHTPQGTPVRVTIGSGTLKSGTPAVTLDVIDSGPGMTTEQAQHVFERFYRADTSRGRSSGGGTGLGLAIVAGLVQAHGGAVSVRTAPGQGADFRVKLPLSPDAMSPDDMSPDDMSPGDRDGDDEADQDAPGFPAYDEPASRRPPGAP